MKESEDARWAGVKSEKVGRITLSPHHFSQSSLARSIRGGYFS